MNKNSKILIIGFGSIGQRHYRNLSKLGYREVYVYDVDKEKVKDLKSRTVKKISPNELKRFKVAFICSPNNQHVSAALKCARAGCHLFIEKPLSHNLSKLNQLINICQNKKLITLVGCNMRFHPCLRFIKDYLTRGRLGRVYSLSHEFGYWLPYWRPNQDYRKNYAARKKTGGGIILDDLHEFDLLFWLNGFSEVKQSKFVVGKVSDLKIETEDICLASFKFKNGVLGSVKCDYLQKNYTRNCRVVGDRGSLWWDFNDNIVWFKDNKTAKKLLVVKNLDFNEVYLDEVKYYFDCLNKKRAAFNDVKTAAKVLKICLTR